MANPPQERYIKQHQLGVGGMGEVWLAQDTLLNRPVALKYLMATQDTIQKDFFLAEARTLASLNHPHITLIYDAVFDAKQGMFYLVMEYVEGQTLAALLEQWAGVLPLEMVLDVMNGVLQALQYAHDKGVVHRDIKPANVIIQKEGVKLTDFGVAGLISLLSKGADYLVGTPTYMSPEQIDGQGLDGRTDLYSLGVMLFEMLSGGRLPFLHTDNTDILLAHLKEPPPPLREFVPQVHPALEHMVNRLLAKNPADRYPSAGAALEIIKSIQARHKYSQGHLKWLESESKPFVDRVAEMSQLATVWADIQKTGRPQLAVVKGKPGLGKSRLCVEFLGREVVDKGFVVVAGKCAETEVSYAPYAEILGTVLGKGLTKTTVTTEQINLLLEHIPGLARLLNISRETPARESSTPRHPTSSGLWQVLSTKVGETPPPAPPPDHWQVYNIILTILVDLGPTTLFLEDANSLDEASLTLTRYLLRQEQLPLFLLAACRESDQPITWLDTLATDELVVLSVPPLPSEAIQVYLAQTMGGKISAAVVNVVHERSQGNPLRLEEIVPQLVASKEIYQEEGEWRYTPKKLEAPDDAFLPKAVFDAFSRQLDSLSEEYREALALAALLEDGPEFDYDLWLAVLGGESKKSLAENVLIEAGKKRLVRQVAEQRYAFRSVDISRALTQTFTDTARREQHRHIAKLLSQRPVLPTLVSYHYEEAGLTSEAIHYLESAGAQAVAAQTLSTAIDCYQRLVVLRNSSPAYQALGQLYDQTGRQTEAVQAFQQALHLAEQQGNSTDQARSLNGLAGTLWRYDQYKEAYQHAVIVLKMVDLPESELAVAQTHLGVILRLLGRLDEAENWSRQAVQTAQKSRDEAALAEACYQLASVYLSQGKLKEAPPVLQQTLTLYQKLTDRRGQAECWHALGKVAAEVGLFAEAMTWLKPAEQLFKQWRNRTSLVAIYTTWGRVLLYQGLPEESLALLNQALPPTMELSKHRAHILSDFYLLIAQASLAVGKLDRARSAAENALKLVEPVGNMEYAAHAQGTLAQIYAAQGEAVAAGMWYQKALTLFERLGCRPGLVRTQWACARFLQGQGQTAEAEKLEQSARSEAAKMGLYLPEAES